MWPKSSYWYQTGNQVPQRRSEEIGAISKLCRNVNGLINDNTVFCMWDWNPNLTKSCLFLWSVTDVMLQGSDLQSEIRADGRRAGEVFSVEWWRSRWHTFKVRALNVGRSTLGVNIQSSFSSLNNCLLKSNVSWPGLDCTRTTTVIVSADTQLRAAALPFYWTHEIHAWIRVCRH